MATKKEQAGQILLDALGGSEQTQTPVTFPEPPETAAESEAVASDGDITEADVNDDGPAADLNDLAEALGLSIEDVYGLQVPMADGESPRSLGDMKDAERRAAELGRKLTALQTEHDTAKKAISTLQSQGSAAFQGMPQELDQARLNAARWHEHVHNNPAYWNQLKEADPGTYAAELVQAQTTAQQTAQQFQMGAMQWQEMQKRQLDELITEKRRKLAERDSTWADEDTRKGRYRLISEWLRDSGADVPENLDQILVDPGWAIPMSDAAQAWKNAKTAGSKVTPHVGTSKLKRSALKTAAGSTSRSRIDTLVKRAQSGKRVDKAAAGEAILSQALKKRS